MDFRTTGLLLLLTTVGRAFDPAQDVALAVVPGGLRMVLPPGVHVKVGTFRVALAPGPGRLEVGPMPPAVGRDAAGDPVWRGTVVIPLRGRGLADPVRLAVTCQPCTEGPNGVCYLPQHRTVSGRAADLAPVP